LTKQNAYPLKIQGGQAFANKAARYPSQAGGKRFPPTEPSNVKIFFFSGEHARRQLISFQIPSDCLCKFMAHGLHSYA
jgi:hypothetical protein